MNELIVEAEKIAKRIARSFSFGYYTPEDISQEIFIMCMEAYASYDGKRKLSNFLYSHCRNRLINLKRNKFWRAEAPCKKCASGNFCEPPKGCNKHLTWLKINSSKACLAHTCNQQPKDRTSNQKYHADSDEHLNNAIPAKLRKYYLMILDGVSIPLEKKEELKEYAG